MNLGDDGFGFKSWRVRQERRGFLYSLVLYRSNLTEEQVPDFYPLKFNNELKRIALSNFDYRIYHF